MQRIPEPELMNEKEQAKAYAEADFSESHNLFVDLFQEAFKDRKITGSALDLGCGPGDVSCRFARRFPAVVLHGVDGSQAMLDAGGPILKKYGFGDRVQLFHGFLPGACPPLKGYDIVISNSLLHHLADPMTLWTSARKFGRSGAMFFVMDLKRPESREAAAELVQSNAADEPEVLRQDYLNSLLAAYTIEEVRDQLQKAGLGKLAVAQASDRHLSASGYLP